ncbi:MAG: hypothetical protein IJ728_06420 [Selenomonadaceae bacterium]|nr:hypothetical protein [Selenomonadaceae bacterium]
MWISKVDDLMKNEQNDSAQFNSNPLTTNNDFSNLRSPLTTKRPMVQRVVNLSDLQNDNAVVVSLSQKRFNVANSYSAALSGVDESLFMAD